MVNATDLTIHAKRRDMEKGPLTGIFKRGNNNFSNFIIRKAGTLFCRRR